MKSEKELGQSKFERIVNPYSRKEGKKVVRVSGYKQRYPVPRGPVKKLARDNLTKSSQTMWLMDKYGRFIGRANYQGQTSATGVSKFGYDQTSTVRDARKYKRIFGRMRNPRTNK